MATDESEDVLEDPAYRAAMVELLGALAYGEVAAFERLAQDATLAPNTADKAALHGMAATEHGHYRHLSERIVELGADPLVAMAPFQRPIDEFHDRTAPADWYESLVKAYVGEGLVADFYREIAFLLDRRSREIVTRSLEDEGQVEFAVQRVQDGIAADPRLGGRLALYGRRLMGEALVQAQTVVAERDVLTGLLAGDIGRPSLDLAALAEMFDRLTHNHIMRMGSLGLQH